MKYAFKKVRAGRLSLFHVKKSVTFSPRLASNLRQLDLNLFSGGTTVSSLSRIVILATALLIAATTATAAGETYGAGVTLDTVTKVSAIFASPADYIDKEVVIEGAIVDVCRKRGCWMEVASDKEFQSIRVKVLDGVIVFPLNAKGKNAKVQGVVELTGKMDKDKDGNKTCPTDPSAYRLRTSGAVIN
jgi:hypothetical protein